LLPVVVALSVALVLVATALSVLVSDLERVAQVEHW
jgi:hypothetical protein